MAKSQPMNEGINVRNLRVTCTDSVAIIKCSLLDRMTWKDLREWGALLVY